MLLLHYDRWNVGGWPIEKQQEKCDICGGNEIAGSRNNVHIGKILSIKKNTWVKREHPKGVFMDWRVNFQLEVITEDGIISIIKNPNSFVII